MLSAGYSAKSVHKDHGRMIRRGSFRRAVSRACARHRARVAYLVSTGQLQASALTAADRLEQDVLSALPGPGAGRRIGKSEEIQWDN